MSLYMKLPNIPGSAIAVGFKNWINIKSMSFGYTRYVDVGFDQKQFYEFGLPNFDDVVICRDIDRNSPTIMSDGWKTTTYPEVLLIRPLQGVNRPPFIRYKLKQAVVTGYQLSHYEDERPYETFNLQYQGIETSYIEQSDKKEATTEIIGAYFDMAPERCQP